MHRYDKQKIYTYISTLTASTPQPLVVEFVSSCQNQYILSVNDLIECKLKRGGGWVIHFFGGGMWVGRRGNLKSIIYNSCSPRFISTNFILLVSLVYWKPASIYLSQDCCYCSAGCIDFIKYFYMYIMYLYPQKKYF